MCLNLKLTYQCCLGARNTNTCIVFQIRYQNVDTHLIEVFSQSFGAEKFSILRKNPKVANSYQNIDL